MIAESFNTVREKRITEQIIEKSRFIASIAPVYTTVDVLHHMRITQEEYPNARHYVYAYRLQEGRLEKCSDDGEPQGTGGRPILDLLQHRQVWNVQIIVVRYFGGVLLGTGGLARAYGGTARLALNDVGIIQLVPHYMYTLNIPYPWYEQIKYFLKQKGWEYDNEQFYESISLDVYVTKEESTEFESLIDEITNRQVMKQKAKEIMRPQ